MKGRVEELTASFSRDGKSFTLDVEEDGVSSDATFTMDTYVMNSDPSTDTPSVRSQAVPAISECEALWKAENDAACAADSSGGCGGDSEVAHSDVDETSPPLIDLDTLVGSDRKLGWSESPGQNAATMAHLASFGYTGAGALPSGWVHYKDCITGNSVARFGSKYPVMVLSFAGTDDKWDAIQDLKVWGNDKYHGGFYDYVSMTKSCVDATVDELAVENIYLDYITGHSLGGAAAVVYAQRSSGLVSAAKVVTFGAPKTSKNTSCKTTGTRIFNEKDPVASNGLGVLGGVNHDVSSARQVYNNDVCTKKLLGICTRTSTNYLHRRAGCSQMAGGCSWFFDCLWNVGRHSLDTYRKHGLSGISV